jgi:hypothetical protein
MSVPLPTAASLLVLIGANPAVTLIRSVAMSHWFFAGAGRQARSSA